MRKASCQHTVTVQFPEPCGSGLKKPRLRSLAPGYVQGNPSYSPGTGSMEDGGTGVLEYPCGDSDAGMAWPLGHTWNCSVLSN